MPFKTQLFNRVMVYNWQKWILSSSGPTIFLPEFKNIASILLYPNKYKKIMDISLSCVGITFLNSPFLGRATKTELRPNIKADFF